jgi:hypothetical protein
MMRVCFVGNSHLAAVKLGWDSVSSEYPDVAASFFGAPAAGLTQMERGEDGFLVSPDEALTKKLKALWGTDRFRPDDYDVLCLIGLGTSIRTVGYLYRSFRSSKHRNRSGQFRLLSPECFQAAANGLVARKISARVLALIGSVSKRPVVVAQQPSPCRSVQDTEMLECGDDAALFECFAQAVKRLPGSDFFLPQPESTRANLFTTKPEYGDGSQRLNVHFSKHEDDDTGHMNAEYGALFVHAFYDLLKSEGFLGMPQWRPAQATRELST